MQVQPINTQNNQTSFKAIKYQDKFLNNKNRRTIYDYITRRLNEVDPNDKLKRSFVERAENLGYDVLFTKGKKNNSVRVDFVSRSSETKTAVNNEIPTYNRTHIGTYSCPEQFNIQDFSNAYQSNEKMIKFQNSFMIKLLRVLFTTVVGIIDCVMKKN